MRWRLVQEQPVQPEAPHGDEELLKVDRFADVTVGAKIVAGDQVGLLGR